MKFNLIKNMIVLSSILFIMSAFSDVRPLEDLKAEIEGIDEWVTDSQKIATETPIMRLDVNQINQEIANTTTALISVLMQKSSRPLLQIS